jgi:hypothetical protein
MTYYLHDHLVTSSEIGLGLSKYIGLKSEKPFIRSFDGN